MRSLLCNKEHVLCLLQVNYFPSRFDPVRHSERYPIPSGPIGGKREKAIIFKENNFAQPGARYRGWDPARQVTAVCGVAGECHHQHRADGTGRPFLYI